jgi:hypothetical protein
MVVSQVCQLDTGHGWQYPDAAHLSSPAITPPSNCSQPMRGLRNSVAHSCTQGSSPRAWPGSKTSVLPFLLFFQRHHPCTKEKAFQPTAVSSSTIISLEKFPAEAIPSWGPASQGTQMDMVEMSRYVSVATRLLKMWVMWTESLPTLSSSLWRARVSSKSPCASHF